jgi:hypothetical protein
VFGDPQLGRQPASARTGGDELGSPVLPGWDNRGVVGGMAVVRHRANWFRLGAVWTAADQHLHVHDRTHHPGRDGADQDCHPPWGTVPAAAKPWWVAFPATVKASRAQVSRRAKSFRVRVVPP